MVEALFGFNLRFERISISLTEPSELVFHNSYRSFAANKSLHFVRLSVPYESCTMYSVHRQNVFENRWFYLYLL